MIAMELASTLPALVSLPGIGLAPMAVLALALDAAIVGVWYLIGVVLSNNTVRGSAREEFYQLIGTAVMIGIIIGSLAVFSGLFYNSLGSTKLMNPTAISTMCSNLVVGSGVNLVGGSGSLLSPGQNPSQFPGLCSIVSKKAAPTLTDQIDYPLAATSVIVANLTNQTVSNLNSTFVYDGFVGYLSQLTPRTAFCVPASPGSLSCINPGLGIQQAVQINYTSTPDAGLGMLFSNLVPYGTLLGSAVESFIAQLLLYVIFLDIWPVVLFAGIVMRATFFTRKVGGLLIAVAIGMIMFLPLVYSLEYLAMANGVSAQTAQAYGFSSLTDIPSNAMPSSTDTYGLNFFVMPSMKVALEHSQCWPGIPLSQAEFADAAYLAVPGGQAISLGGQIGSTLASLTQAIPGITPFYYLPINCNQAQGLNAFFILVDAYGITGITAYLLPMINLFMMITAILGLSGLLGGDTTLAGLTKVI